jgi:hypothetical protein
MRAGRGVPTASNSTGTDVTFDYADSAAVSRWIFADDPVFEFRKS